ncbi:hypothetical protein M514_28473, partial [Trichuris suis]
MTFVHVGVQLHAPGTTIRHVLVRCLDGQAASEWYDFIPCHDIHTSTVILSLHGSRASGMTPHTIIYTHAGVIPSNHGNMPAVFIRYGTVWYAYGEVKDQRRWAKGMEVSGHGSRRQCES